MMGTWQVRILFEGFFTEGEMIATFVVVGVEAEAFYGGFLTL